MRRRVFQTRQRGHARIEYCRVKGAHLDPIVLLALHCLFPRIELLALVDVLAAGAAEGQSESAAHNIRSAAGRETTHLHLMLKGAMSRTTCCLSLGIFRRGILLARQDRSAWRSGLGSTASPRREGGLTSDRNPAGSTENHRISVGQRREGLPSGYKTEKEQHAPCSAPYAPTW